MMAGVLRKRKMKNNKLKSFIIALLLLVFCCYCNLILASNRDPNVWYGINAGVFYPEEALISGGVSLGYKNVNYSMDVGFFIHTTSVAHSISTYPIFIALPRINWNVSPLIGIYYGKISGSSTDKDQEAGGLIGGVGFQNFKKSISVNIGYFAKYEDGSLDAGPLPMVKFIFKL